MKVPVSLSESVVLAAGGVTYAGPISLVQFTVEGTRMVLKNPQYLAVEITMKRMFQYHLAATFLPTILLMIITEITLFVDEKHFEVTVMIHLTTMLVMYTLYQGLQSIMPKTAYLKHVDIFLLYGVIVPFITFLVEVASKLLAGEEKPNEKKNEEDKLGKVICTIRNDSNPLHSSTEREMAFSEKNEVPKRQKIRRALKYTSEKVIPIFTAIFLSIYSGMAVYYYIYD